MSTTTNEFFLQLQGRYQVPREAALLSGIFSPVLKDLFVDANLFPLHQRVMEARFPEEVYSSENIILPPEFLLDFLEEKHQEMAVRCDPQRYSNPQDCEAAREARLRLEELYAEAKARIALGFFGLDGFGRAIPAHASKSFRLGAKRYYIGTKLAETERATSYRGYLEYQGVNLGALEIHVARTAADNVYLERELRMLHALHLLAVPQWKHLPIALDSFRSGARLAMIVRNAASVSLAQAREDPLHLAGIDQKHMVWMLDRLLSLLGYVHSQGIVHCGVRPEVVFLGIESHNCVLANWQDAVENPAQRAERSQPPESEFLAPEVRAAGEIGPWSDIYSLGKLMIWTLGGEPRGNVIPESVQWPIRDLLLEMVEEQPLKRAADAWELHAKQNAIKDSLWERKFIPFVLS